LALAYLVGAEAGHALSFPGSAFATFWPPSGILLASLLLSGTRHWPLLLAGSLVANTVSNVGLHDKSLLVSLVFWLGNAGEALVAAWLVGRCKPFALASVRDALVLITVGGCLASAVSATVGTAALALAYGTESWAITWCIWWAADTLGVVVVAPAILLLSRCAWSIHLSWRQVEGLLMLAAIGLLTECTYGGWLSPLLSRPVLVFPLLLWLTFRFDPWLQSLALNLLTFIVVYHTARGEGTIATTYPVLLDRVLVMQVFLSVTTFSLLAVGVLVTDRRRDQEQLGRLNGALQAALAEVKVLQGLLPICMCCKQIRDDDDNWQQLEAYITKHSEVEFTHGICPRCLEEQCEQLATSARSS
jgi:integral membrane sensor domain MASE1